MTMCTMKTALLLTALVSSVSAQFTIQPDEFYMGATMGMYDAIIDVRSQSEWDAGHIENATLELNLASMRAIPTNSDILGCEGQCETIVVYCRSGARAGVAIQLLLDSGFNGTIYNGLGVSQWQSAGYPLVTGDSTLPKCSAKFGSVRGGEDPCRAEDDESMVPSSNPSTAPSSSSAPSQVTGSVGTPTQQAVIASDMPSVMVDSGMPSLELEADTLEVDTPSASPTYEPTSGASFFRSVGRIVIAFTSVLLVGLYY